MNRRNQLGLVIILSIAAIVVVMLASERQHISTIVLLSMGLTALFSSRYATRDLGQEGGLKWFMLSLMPHVPFIMLLEKPVLEKTFSSDMPVGGKEPASYGLGELAGVFTPPAGSHLYWKIALVIMAAFLSPIAAIPALDRGPKSGWLAMMLPLFFFIGLTVLFIWISNKSRRTNKQKWVALFQNGLAFSQKGMENGQFRWTDVLEVWQNFSDQYVNGIRTSHVRHCRVVTRQHKPGYHFNQKLKDIEQLIANIHHEATVALLPGMGETLGGGQTLMFGKISLSEQGVGLKKEILPWSQLAGIYLESGYMVIARLSHSSSEARMKSATQGFSAFVTRIAGTAQPHAPGGDAVIWKKTPISETPNPVTLTVLVSEILQKISTQAMS